MSFLRLHTFIAIVGLSLPFIMLVGLGVPTSISETWYSHMRDVFVGALCACGAFFICNQGYDFMDDFAFNLCGVCFLLIAFFPCEGYVEYMPSWHSCVHYVAACILFFTLGTICFFLFTKSKGNMTEEKLKRNLIYEVCGITIYFSILTLLTSNFIFMGKFVIFYNETVMLIAFCTAFIVKGTSGRIIGHNS